MNIPLAVKFEGKKYMWDGISYETEDAAQNNAETYRKDGFEVKLSMGTGRYLVYTRRIAAVQAAE